MAERQNVADVSAGGDWLFRQGELVLGPIQARQVVEKLNTGELTGRTEVAPMGDSRFRPIADTDFFKVHLAKAEAKLRVEAAAAAASSKAARKRNAIIGAVTLVALVCAIGAAAFARYLAVHNPFKDDEEFAAGMITIEPPKIVLARAQPRNDEELLEYRGNLKMPPPPPGTTQHPNGTASASAKTPGSGKKGGSVSEDADGLQTASFDQDAINGVVASNQKKLFTCFREEASRNPGFAAKIPMEFVIGNDGHVNKLWVDNPTYKQGPLADCLLRELQKWPFKPFEGENPSVSLSFTIGKKG